jgi:hypothetical protein
MIEALPSFLGGAIVLGYVLIGVFFLKFWRRTNDTFFGYFAVAFFTLGIGRVIEAITRTNETTTPYVYVFRLLAFLIIIFAIMHKNLASKK